MRVETKPIKQHLHNVIFTYLSYKRDQPTLSNDSKILKIQHLEKPPKLPEETQKNQPLSNAQGKPLYVWSKCFKESEKPRLKRENTIANHEELETKRKASKGDLFWPKPLEKHIFGKIERWGRSLVNQSLGFLCKRKSFGGERVAAGRGFLFESWVCKMKE